MPLEEYHKALRQGLKEEKEAIARGEEPGLRVLPENPDTLAVRRGALGGGGNPPPVSPLTRPFPCLIGKRFPLTPQSWAFRMVRLFLASGGFETSSGFARPNGTPKPDAIFHPPTGAASPNFSVGKIGAPVV